MVVFATARIAPQKQFLALAAAAVAPCVGLLLWVSPWVALGFMGAVVAMGWVFYILPQRSRVPVRHHLQQLREHGMLILLWLKYNILSRYNQKVLGILWIVLLPLSTSLILALVFSEILKTPQLTGVPFVAFFLTALTPWTIFSQSMFGATTAILANMSLISAVPIPREVPVIRTLGESLVDGLFMFICMLVINLLLGIVPGSAFLFLPVIILTQICGMLGLMFFISAASVIIRDIPQFVSVIMQFLFYLTPIVYPAELVPAHLQIILWLNPLYFVTTAYRMIILHNQLPDLHLIYGAFVISLLVLCSGYLFFKSYDHLFADYV